MMRNTRIDLPSFAVIYVDTGGPGGITFLAQERDVSET